MPRAGLKKTGKPFKRPSRVKFYEEFNAKLDELRNNDDISKNAKVAALRKMEHSLIKEMKPQQIRFCEEYLKDFNTTQAAARSGYSEAYARTGTGIMQAAGIKEYVAIIREVRALQLNITADFVVAEFDKLAKVKASDLYDQEGHLIPPHKLPDHIAAAVQEVKEKRTTLPSGIEIVEFTYKLHSKVAALDALGKHTGIYERDNKQKNAGLEPSVIFYLPENGREVKTQEKNATTKTQEK